MPQWPNGWSDMRITGLSLLAAIVLVSGVFSAFFVNDTMCLVLTPLVLEIVLALGRNPVPYLLAVAMASNIGSVATITGNPQNMMIGSLFRHPLPPFCCDPGAGRSCRSGRCICDDRLNVPKGVRSSETVGSNAAGFASIAS